MRIFLANGFSSGRLFDALPGAVKAPAVIHAADRVAFDPAGRELRAAMRAAEIDEMRRAALAAVKREALAHDLDRLGLSRVEIFGAMDGMPEPTLMSRTRS
jgi:hypothetical protein